MKLSDSPLRKEKKPKTSSSSHHPKGQSLDLKQSTNSKIKLYESHSYRNKFGQENAPTARNWKNLNLNDDLKIVRLTDESNEKSTAKVNGFNTLKPAPKPIHLHRFSGKKLLILDLDETLLHSTFQEGVFDNPQIITSADVDGVYQNIYANLRPGLNEFLARMSSFYEIAIFTASSCKYANALIDRLDIKNNVTHRLYREHCVKHNNMYIKYLSNIQSRSLREIVIVDNNPNSYLFNKDNGIPVRSWFIDKDDKELFTIIPILEFLAKVDDVRGLIPKFIENNCINYSEFEKVKAVWEMSRLSSTPSGSLATSNLNHANSNNNFLTTESNRIKPKVFMQKSTPSSTTDFKDFLTLKEKLKCSKEIGFEFKLSETLKKSQAMPDPKLEKLRRIDSLLVGDGVYVTDSIKKYNNFLLQTSRPKASRKYVSLFSKELFFYNVLKNTIFTKEERDLMEKEAVLSSLRTTPLFSRGVSQNNLRHQISKTGSMEIKSRTDDMKNTKYTKENKENKNGDKNDVIKENQQGTDLAPNSQNNKLKKMKSSVEVLVHPEFPAVKFSGSSVDTFKPKLITEKKLVCLSKLNYKQIDIESDVSNTPFNINSNGNKKETIESEEGYSNLLRNSKTPKSKIEALAAPEKSKQFISKKKRIENKNKDLEARENKDDHNDFGMRFDIDENGKHEIKTSKNLLVLKTKKLETLNLKTKKNSTNKVHKKSKSTKAFTLAFENKSVNTSSVPIPV